MQPLDEAFFKPLKSAFNSSADTWMLENQGKKMSFYYMADILASAAIDHHLMKRQLMGLEHANYGHLGLMARLYRMTMLEISKFGPIKPLFVTI